MFNIKIKSFLTLILLSMFTLQLFLNKLAVSLTYRYNSLILLSILLLILLTVTEERFHTNKGLLVFLFIWFFISVIYFFFLCLYRGFGWFTYITFFRNATQYYIVIFAIALIKDVTDLKTTVVYSILFLSLFESIIGLGQMFHLDLILQISELKPYMMADRLVSVDNYSTGVNLPHGTLERYSVYGNALALMSIYLISINSFIKKINVNYKLYIFTILINLFMIFMSGNRIALIGTLLAINLLLFLKYIKFFFVYLAIVFCLAIVLKSTIFSIGGEYGRKLSMDNPLTRQLAVFSIASEDTGKGVSTFLLNSYMLEQASKNIITGVGFFQKPNGYDGIITKISNNFTDVMLLWLVAEFGLIGFTLYFLPVFYILKRANKGSFETKLVVFPLFVCVFTQTITDPGIFDPVTGFIFLLLVSTHVFCDNTALTAPEATNEVCYEIA